jgi:putative two-component system response regulator
MDKINIVVVDDQPAICKEVATFLRNDANVHAFKSGKEALAYLERSTADVILLDYHMPEMTGFEVLLAIRQNKSYDDTPVIFLTAEINERMEYEMVHRGANDYLRKPIDAGKLQACIKKALGQ